MNDLGKRLPRGSILFAGGILLLASPASAQEAPPQPPAAPPQSVPGQPVPGAPAPTLGKPTPRISFEEAVKRALARNPTSEVAREEINRAQALVQQARSTWLPMLSANGLYTRLDANREFGGRTLAAIDTLNLNLLLTVPIISPKQWVATTRAKENRELAKVAYADTRRTIAIAAGKAYLTVIAERRVLESSVQARDTARSHEEFAKSRFTGGVGNRLDYVRASQERATAETRVQTQTLALSRSQEALGILLDENGPVDAVDVELPAPPSLDAAITDAEKTRSDVVVSRDRAEYARRAVRDSYADYLPMLSGNAEPFYQTPASSTTPQTGWQAQLLLSIPLYDGGNRYGLKHERDAFYEEAKIKLEAALKQARSDVRVAFEAVQRADDALAKAREASKLAEEALQLTQLAYRAGATSNLEVVDAERSARDAQIDAAVAEDASRQARLDLLAGAGKFP